MVQPLLGTAVHGGQRLFAQPCARVTDENNAFKPQILAEALHLELDKLDKDKVYA